MIKLKDILHEIGEGVKPFPFKPWGTITTEDWIKELKEWEPNADMTTDPDDRRFLSYKFYKKLGYEFQSEKGDYFVSIDGSAYATPDPAKTGRKWDIRFRADFGTKQFGDTTTNLGEQFAVMSTVVAVVKDVIAKLESDKKYQVRRMEFFPKREKGDDTGPEGTQRGKLYLAYIQKQLPQFEGQWKVRTGMDNFVVERIDNA